MADAAQFYRSHDSLNGFGSVIGLIVMTHMTHVTETHQKRIAATQEVLATGRDDLGVAQKTSGQELSRSETPISRSYSLSCPVLKVSKPQEQY